MTCWSEGARWMHIFFELNSSALQVLYVTKPQCILLCPKLDQLCNGALVFLKLTH